MNAGAFTHRLTFLRAEKEQTASGAVRERLVEHFHARAFLRTLRPTYDKDGLQAREIVDTSAVVFVVRSDKRLPSAGWLRFNGMLYRIVLLQPMLDRTVQVTARFIDE